jgi:hypothetical protein
MKGTLLAPGSGPKVAQLLEQVKRLPAHAQLLRLLETSEQKGAVYPYAPIVVHGVDLKLHFSEDGEPCDRLSQRFMFPAD